MPDHYRYILQTTSRVSAARAGEKLHHTPAHGVIPGGTLRGALAAVWWRDASSRGEGHDQFHQLFDRGLRVGQAAPVGDGVSGGSATVLSSASTYVCKYEPLAGCQAFERDLALEVAAGRPAAEPRCGECHGPATTAPGWRIGHARVRATRTELKPDGTAKDGNLFFRDAMPSGLTLSGRLTCPDACDLDWLNGQAIRIGGKRSVMGAATITLTADTRPIGELPPRVALRLRSPAVIVDAYGADSLAEADLLTELRRVSGTDVTIVRSWLRSEHVTGWHMRSALPKPADWALAAGSMTVVEGLTTNGWLRLQAGIGLRTLEGYGDLEVLALTPETAHNAAGPVPDPPPEQSHTDLVVDGLVEAFVAGGHGRHLLDAQAALAAVRKARAARYGQPDTVARQHRRKPFAKNLDPLSAARFKQMLDDTELDPEVLNKLGTRISQLGREGK